MLAWIEIKQPRLRDFERSVASYMLAWIEMGIACRTSPDAFVASYMLAWIEIKPYIQDGNGCTVSQAICLRGLKCDGKFINQRLKSRKLYACVD